MENWKLTCFLARTIPTALIRLGADCMSIARIWREMEWMTSWF